MGSPSAVASPQLDQIAKIFLDRGFAVAASVQISGFALPRCRHTEALRQYFRDKYGARFYFYDRSSMGGVALA